MAFIGLKILSFFICKVLKESILFSFSHVYSSSWIIFHLEIMNLGDNKSLTALAEDFSGVPPPFFRGENLVDYLGNHWSMTREEPPLGRQSVPYQKILSATD